MSFDAGAAAPLVYETGTHGTACEFSVMQRDGLVVPVGPRHWLRADAQAWPRARRLALAAALGPGMVAALHSAAWAWGGPPLPDGMVDALVPPGTGGRAWLPELRLHRCRLDPADVQLRDGLAFTSPVRTLVDLAAWAGPEADPAVCWLAGDVDLSAAQRALTRRGRVHGVEQARQVLALLLDGVADPLAQVTPAQVTAGRPRSGTRHTPRRPA